MYHQLPESCRIIDLKLPKCLVPYRYAKGVEWGLGGTIVYAGICAALSIVNLANRLISARKLMDLKKTDIVIAFSGYFNDLMFVASGYVPGIKIAWLHGAEFEYKIISDGYSALYRKIKNLVCLSELCDITCAKFNQENGIRKN